MEKFFLKSRAFWAMAAPIVALIVQTFGPSMGLDQEMATLIAGGLGAGGLAAAFRHFAKPDNARILFRKR